MKLPLVVALILVVHAAPAWAQSVFVAGVAGAETFLNPSLEAEGQPSFETGGTAPFAGARVGLALGSNWGIELEAVHNFGVEKTNDRGFPMPVDFGGGIATGLGSRMWPLTVETETQRTTWTPSLWVAHTLNERVALIFLAGAAFTRTAVEQEMTFPRGPLGRGGITAFFEVVPVSMSGQTRSGIFDLQPPVSQETRATSYDVAPSVGVDVALCFGDHFRVAPGIRLSGTNGTWALRSGVSVGWQF